MSTLSRRGLVSALALGVAFTAVAPRAKADLFGGDIAVLSAILIQSIETAISTADTVFQLVNQLKMLQQMLKRLDLKSWDDIKALYSETKWTADTMTSGVQVLSFRLNELKNSWNRIYPTDYRPVPTPQMKKMVDRWNRETVGAAEVAARTQTMLAGLESIEKTADHALQLSMNSDGQLQQMQANVQMLGVVHRQLSLMISTGTTLARAQAVAAAAAASERAMSEEKKKRNLVGYKNKGAQPVAMKTLP